MSPIERLIDDANPIVDPRMEFDEGDMRALLTLTLERNADMDMKELTKPVETEPKRGRPWIAAVAFAAVIVVVGGALVLFTGGNDDSTPPASSESTVTSASVEPEADASDTTVPLVSGPVMTEAMLSFIEAYEAAFNSGNADAFRATLAPGAFRVDKRAPELTIPSEALVGEMINLHVRQTTIELVDCVPAETTMTCTTTFDGPVEQAIYGLAITSRDTFTVDSEGKLLKIAAGGITDDYLWAADGFRNWMSAEHPEIHAQMIARGFNQVLAQEDSEIYLEWAPVWAELGRPTP